MDHRNSLAWTLVVVVRMLVDSASANAEPAHDDDLLDVPHHTTLYHTTPSVHVATDMPQTTSRPAPDWRERVDLACEQLQAANPLRLARLSAGPLAAVKQADLQDTRAASVLLRRLIRGGDPIAVRAEIAEALPQIGGDWQEAAAALIASEPAAAVRKRLVEAMRYADPPHSLPGLRRGFHDEDPAVNIAAARTTGFTRGGGELFPELFSSTFSADWELRAAALQSLGMLRLPRSRELLIKGLADEEREVRVQALLSLEQLDPLGVLDLPQLEKLARDRKSFRVAREAERLLRQRRAAERATAPRTVSR